MYNEVSRNKFIFITLKREKNGACVLHTPEQDSYI